MKPLRGISPVVATALLVLIAVAVSVLLYTWVSGTVTSQPTSSPGLEERIKIDAVNVTTAGGTVTIYVHNLGNINATIKAAYLINANTGSIIASNTSVGVTIPPGNSSEVLITKVPSIPSGTTVIAKVVTENGVEATYITTVRG